MTLKEFKLAVAAGMLQPYKAHALPYLKLTPSMLA